MSQPNWTILLSHGEEHIAMFIGIPGLVNDHKKRTDKMAIEIVDFFP
jgi:hypothetical protein